MLATCSPWFALVATLAYWIYYERIAYAEEEFLSRRFGARHLAWAQRTPAFVPRLAGWRAPALPFFFLLRKGGGRKWDANWKASST